MSAESVSRAVSRLWQAAMTLFLRGWRATDSLLEQMITRDGRKHAVAHDFKPDVVAIEEAPIPISTFSALYVVLALIVIAIIWSLIGKVDRIIVAQGKIVTTAPVIVMQPFTTSRIQKIYVQPGDRVHKGQVLVSFDPLFAKADENSLKQKVRALTAERDRMEAELSGAKSFDVGPDPYPERRAEAALFAQRLSEFRAEMDSHDSKRRQIDAQLSASRTSVEGLRHQMRLANDVVAIWRRLDAVHAGSTLQQLIAEKDSVEAEVKYKDAVQEENRLEQARAEAVAEQQSFLQQWNADLSQKLVTARQDAAEATEELNKAHKLSELTQLRAPIDAVVLELADRSEGSVMREAETLITLVPANAPLRVDAQVLSRDVGFIAVGDKVRVKLEAYPFQRFGTVQGKLDVVSPDSVDVKEGDNTNVVFKAEIRLDDTAWQIAARGIKLRAGLIATAEIKAGERSIASYILDPIVQTTHEALREP